MIQKTKNVFCRNALEVIAKCMYCGLRNGPQNYSAVAIYFPIPYQHIPIVPSHFAFSTFCVMTAQWYVYVRIRKRVSQDQGLLLKLSYSSYTPHLN